MTALLSPADAVAALRGKLERRWADAVCAELGGGEQVTFSVPIRPGVTTGKAVEGIGHAAWHAWHMGWLQFAGQLPAGARIVERPVSVGRLPRDYPATLTADLAGAIGLMPDAPVDVDRARALASALHAVDANLTPATLRATYRLRDADADVLVSAVDWLHQHLDARQWSLRQLPVPGMHTKWIDAHGALLRDAAGRDVRAEVRPRPTAVHLTYVDPGHIAAGHRRHDSWTSGDTHDLAYHPRTVLVVENRDSRLWFPPQPDTVVVEGGGRAAAALLADIPWVRHAEHVVYWGDIDADGYAILDHFRAALATPVRSILMDAGDLHRYAQHGINHDRFGRPIKPSPQNLPNLTPAEATAYDTIATAGETPFRRIEQELIPLDHAAERLRAATE